MSGHVAKRPRLMPTWIVVTIAGIFGLFYAYAVWNSLGNLIQTLAFTPLNLGGWIVWLFAIVFPIVVFALAFALGYRRRAVHFALILLAGLAVVAVFWLDLLAYLLAGSASLIG
jgi:hypothetical protein